MMRVKWIICITIIVCGLFSLGTKKFAEIRAQQLNVPATEQIQYEQHRFYGESLHFDSSVPFNTYILQNVQTKQHYTFNASPTNDEGILLAQLTEGVYRIQLDKMTIATTDFQAQTWYTIMRHGEANEIILFVNGGTLYLQVNIVNELPENVYDIVIDPGHGGVDSGAIGYGLYESEEVLKFSQALAQYLTSEYGLKVRLTREGNSEPAGDETYSLEQSAYYENGRVTQVYDSQAKLVLSNHLNTTSIGTASGFQVYSAFETTNTLAAIISETLQAAGMEPSLLESEAAIGAGTYKQVAACEERVVGVENCTQEYEDYFFMIRETGGLSTGAQNIINYNDQYTEIPSYGAQALLIEYAFIDNYSDNLEWQQNWQDYAIAIGDAIAQYILIKN